jgi:hypothetical protein
MHIPTRRAVAALFTSLLAACSGEGLTGGLAPALDPRAARVEVIGGTVVQGDEGTPVTLAGASALSLQDGPLSVEWEFGDGSASEVTTSETGELAIAHTWDDNAEAPYSAVAYVSNVAGESEALRFDVTIANVPPSATLVAPTSTNAGTPFALTLADPFDPSTADVAAGFTYSFDCGDGAGFGEPSAEATVTCAGAAAGTRTVLARIADKDGEASEYETSFDVVDACLAPSSVSIATPSDPIQLGMPVAVTVQFADAGDAGTTVEVTWSDGVTASVSPSGGVATLSRSFSTAGVFTATATVSNGCGAASASTTTYVVIFDPSAGFVTGGGWIMAAPGSYTDDPSLSGKATFGFVAKYKQGAHVPTGHTEFQFHANGLDFKSGTYEWLVIAGSRAQYKGVGTIKGMSGTFNFLLTAIDGGPGGANDAFRMKIMDSTGGIVFDNRQGASDNSNDTTALAGGSISIKKQ